MKPKAKIKDLALFGGPKLFDTPRPIGQLDAPCADDYLQLIRTSFESRNFSNQGPLVIQLEEELRSFHGVRHCIALANAGLGLTMLMQLFSKGEKGEVIMPAFSYRGLPHIAQWAGQTPRFCDVDPQTHALAPDRVAESINEKTTSILSVCNFNSPGHIDEIASIAKENGIPYILDSVYGLGATHNGVPLGRFGDAEVFSAHATKLLNGFEGGYITTNNDDLAETLRSARNFALPNPTPAPSLPNAHVLGINAKLNELHAAMALLSLERLDGVIARNQERYQAYQSCVTGIAGLSLVPCDTLTKERRNFQLSVLDVQPPWQLSRDETLAILKAEGAAVSAYYSPALHRSEHCPRGLEVESMPVSEDLARRFCQLPVGEMVSLDDVAAIGELLSFISRHSAEISERDVGEYKSEQ